MLKRQIFRGIKSFVLLYLLFFAACCILPPLIHREAAAPEELWETADLAGKDRVLCIDDNGEALTWRLRVIEEAKEELVMSVFDFRADNSGKDLMAALYQAADRGVKVKVIVDGIPGTFYLRGNRTFRGFASHPNIQVRFYNPVDPLTPWKINYRMHDKYLMADGGVFLLGGRNANDLFLGEYREKQNVDRDILVWPEEEGGVALQLKAYFDSVWEQPDNEEPAYSLKKYGKEQEKLKERYEYLRGNRPEAFEDVDWCGETLAADRVSLLSNQAEAKKKSPVLWQQLCSLMEGGEQVFVETPYMICNKEMYRKIAAVSGGGKRIQIMLNAPQGGANPFGCADYLGQKENILGTGSEVYEWAGEQSLHTKTVLLDDRISVVGSYNLDIRSTFLDTETMLVIDCAELNGMLREEVQTKTEKSMHVMPDGTEYPGAAYQPMEQSILKKIRSGILRVVLVPFRHLL